MPPVTTAAPVEEAASPLAALGAAVVSEAARQPVYLDYGASTPCDPAAAALMARVLAEDYANPSSAHRAGKRAAAHIATARERIAEAVGALPEEIVFTSGATEANNLAILGAAAFAEERGDPRRRIVTLGIEHPSVLAPCRKLAKRGFDLVTAPVAADGTVRLAELPRALGDESLLLSIQTANNEIGTIQPVAEAAEIAHDRGALVHTDAAQALGKIPFDVEALAVDFASLSAHKCYGPKGIGALWMAGGPRRAPIAPILHGGGHERGLRPGTLNTPAIAGFGEAARIAMERLDEEAPRLAALRDRLEAALLDRIPGATVNGAIANRLPGATSITLPGVDADALIARLPEFALSSASACHAGTPEPSPVLRAIGLSPERAYQTLRLTLGHPTEEASIRHTAARITRELTRPFLQQPDRP